MWSDIAGVVVKIARKRISRLDYFWVKMNEIKRVLIQFILFERKGCLKRTTYDVSRGIRPKSKFKFFSLLFQRLFV